MIIHHCNKSLDVAARGIGENHVPYCIFLSLSRPNRFSIMQTGSVA